jgi:hypothetical protein
MYRNVAGTRGKRRIRPRRIAASRLIHAWFRDPMIKEIGSSTFESCSRAPMAMRRLDRSDAFVY